MKRPLSLIVLAAALLGPAAFAGAGEVSIPEGTVRGHVIDDTCFGPCVAGANPRPFAGEADVVVTNRAGDQVARVAVAKARYQVLVPPGRYRIVAIPYPEQDSNCWSGEARHVRVAAGEQSRRRLHVENVCVQ